jgi:ATP-binding cassette subfamily B protein
MLSWAIMPPFIGALVALFFMWKMHPFFALLLLGWISINISISLAFARHIQKVSEVISEDRSKLSGCIVDVLSNVISVKAFARKMQDLDYVIKYQNIEKQNYKRIIILLNWLRGSMDIQLFAVMTLMVTGSIIGWQRGFVSAGDVAFLVFATNSLMNQVWVMSESFSNLFREIGTAKQSLAVLSESHELLDSASAKDLVVAEGKIEFENVHFSYNKNNSLFSDKNLIIEPGQKVGLVGFSGSGKTTFVNLILRFFDIKAGEIKIDGQNIAKVTQESLRKNIAMIPQEASLFHRSLMENIRYGNLNATDNQVIEAAKKANCHEFIMQLNDDYQTLVGERGIKLSGGQRQRIAIARAILKNAPILILDEATSALDSITEKYIQDSLNQLMQNRTTIVVAHRLSTLAKMDRIIVFDNGKIIEDGNHQMLLNNNSHYAKLWNMQAGGFLPEKEE